MIKVFIGGSRKINKLNVDVRHRIDGIIEKRLPVLIGDANGADKAVQRYLHGNSYDLVEVFCAGKHCRNNIDGWPVRTIPVNGKQKNFGFYAAKDRVMADEAAVGLMIWEGKSMGTLMNMFRLVRQQKKVVVYITQTIQFVDLRNMMDFEALVLRYAPGVKQRLERELVVEQQGDQALRQANLF